MWMGNHILISYLASIEINNLAMNVWFKIPIIWVTIISVTIVFTLNTLLNTQVVVGNDFNYINFVILYFDSILSMLDTSLDS